MKKKEKHKDGYMGKKGASQDNLDHLVIGKLPKDVIDAIGKMKLEVDDLQTWDESRPKFSCIAEKGYLKIRMLLRIPIKKTILWITAFSSVVTILVKLVNYFWPTIEGGMK
jgi:hypothetical protein